MAKSTVMAIVPAYNEAGRIGSTLDKVIKYADAVCVINDGSNDQTKAEVTGYDVTLINHTHNQGKGEAIKTGIEYFLRSDHDIAVFIDADGQHDPADIPKFVKFLDLHPEYDVVVASRFGTPQWQNNMPFLRKLSNLLSRFGIWILYNGLVIEDPQNGYRAYRRKTLQYLDFKTSGYEAETEMIIDAHLKGFEIGRIHIESIYDERGNASKFSLFLDTWKIPGVMVKNFFRRKPFLLRTKDSKIALRKAWKKSPKASISLTGINNQ